MINVHLNGDIIRCPDTAAIYLQNQQVKDSHRICKYNIHEDNCQSWQQSLINWQNVKRNEQAGRCMLSGCDLCPGHLKQKQTGEQVKHFKIDNQTYRKLASSAHYLVKESKTKTLFLTLTFPEFKKTEFNNLLLITEVERNKCLYEINKAFSKFVENLRTNYDCEGYIAVREFGAINNRVHFHILCSIPYHSFATLNSAWCSAISDISIFSKRAVTSDPKTRFVKNPIRAMRYVCKYFNKAKGQHSLTRLVFCSRNIIQRAKQMDAPLESVLDCFNFDYMKQTSDFTMCYRITNNKEFSRFCDQFLYPFFELSVKKSQSLYAFPHNTS